VLIQSDSRDQFKRVATLSDDRHKFTLVWSAPHEASVTVFRVDVAPTGHCTAELSLTPVDAVFNLIPSLPAMVAPGSVIEFETLRGRDERTHFRLRVIAGKYCRRTSSNTELRGMFERSGAPPFRARINRTSKTVSMFVVAQKGELVIYYQDVEPGLNLSPISKDGWILDFQCNQDDLELALTKLHDA
jgi:hypothetical protein